MQAEFVLVQNALFRQTKHACRKDTERRPIFAPGI